MALFLPHHGWHIRLTDADWEEEGEGVHPLGEAALEHTFGIIENEHPDEIILAREYDPAVLKGHPRVRDVREVWFFTTVDPAPFPEKPTGRVVSECGGTAALYYDRDQALADLATSYEPVRQLLELSRSGPVRVRPVARAALDGDTVALTVLPDALEEEAHAQADALRQLSAPPPKAKAQAPRRTRARGQGTEAKPAPAPARKKRSPARSARAAPAEPGPPAAAAPEPGPPERPARQEVVLVGGMPAAGKTSLTAGFTDRGYQRLNRDTLGGKVDDLLPRLDALLTAGSSVVLDNLYATRESRAGAVRLARQRGVPIRFLLLDTSLEDAQFNACLRMLERCGRVLHPEDHKQAPYKNDPGLYPVAVLYKYRKDFEEPTTAEGFSSVEKIPFARRYPPDWVNKAVIFDFDGTLRTHEGKEKYPLRPAEVRALLPRAARVRDYEARGYLLLGASNQSGIAKGALTVADAEACFTETLRQLGLTFREVRYCPHKVPPISCYCRKPSPGMGVELIARYKLDPRQCIYVGDAATDRAFASRCGFQFADQEEFFRT
jgi:HAD superfamily hydrolase (TIGR01662 family)